MAVAGKTAGPAQLGNMLGITGRAVQRLVAQGVLPAPVKGKYAIAEAVRAYVAHRVKSDTEAETAVAGPAKLAALLGITDRRVQQLASEGVLERDGRGQYPVAKAVQAFIDFKVRAELARYSEGTSADEAVKIERARKLRLENEQTERSLVPMAAAIEAIDAIVGPLRSDLAGVPARVTANVGERRAIEDAIHKVLNGIADRLGKAGEALRTGRDPLQAGEEDDG